MLTVEVRKVELDMLPEAAGTVGRQEGAETGEAAGSRHGHLWCVTYCHVLCVMFLTPRLTELDKALNWASFCKWSPTVTKCHQRSYLAPKCWWYVCHWPKLSRSCRFSRKMFAFHTKISRALERAWSERLDTSHEHLDITGAFLSHVTHDHNEGNKTLRDHVTHQ